MPTTMELVILSSSPGAGVCTMPQDPPESFQRVATSSPSPDLLCPRDMSSRTSSGALQSGSRALPIPQAAISGFATTSALLKNRQLSLDGPSTTLEFERPNSRSKDESDAQSANAAKKAVSKRSTISARTAIREPSPKPLRQRKAKASKIAPREKAEKHDIERPAVTPTPETDRPDSRESSKIKAPKPRKPRAKKETSGKETQTTFNKARVTKPKSGVRCCKELEAAKKTRSRKRSTGAVSSHFVGQVSKPQIPGADKPQVPSAELPASDNTITTSDNLKLTLKRAPRRPKDDGKLADNLALESAIVRRMDWTPPRDTEMSVQQGSSQGKENHPPLIQQRSSSFTHMLANYCYANVSEPQSGVNPCSTARDGIIKRRKIELVDVPRNSSKSRDPSPDKTKAPKRKARTITDLVIAQYDSKTTKATDMASEVSAFFTPRKDALSGDTLLQQPGSKEEVYAEKRSSANGEARRRETEVAGKKRKVTAKKAAKPKLAAAKLLSPESAARRVTTQDVLFGTSSQLARDESPTFIRQLQNALRESETDAAFAMETAFTSAEFTASTRLSTTLDVARATRGLWSVSARDSENKLLEKDENFYVPIRRQVCDLGSLVDGAHEASFADIESFQPPQQSVIEISSSIPTPPKQPESPRSLLRSSSVARSFDDIDTFDREPLQVHASINVSFQDIDAFSEKRLYTESNTKTAAQAPLPKRPRNTPTEGAAPKCRRGRPPKSEASQAKPATSKSSITKALFSNSTSTHKGLCTPQRRDKRFINVDEISDSEADSPLSPTPPRLNRVQVPPPLELRPSQEDSSRPSRSTKLDDAPMRTTKIKLNDLEWEGMRSHVFGQISQRVKLQPSTQNPQYPSWYEKILMYDPIVLEDFTVWLNEQGVRAFKKATAKQVKEDLKARRVNYVEDSLVGSVAKADVVDVVEKEIEAWMTQQWCQDKSVCCISKEKIKSGPRKQMY